MKDQGGKKAIHGSHEEKNQAQKNSKQKQFLGSKIKKKTMNANAT